MKDKGKIKKGDVICDWDPFNATIISEYGGIAQFEDIEDGITFRIERDDQTGYAEKVIVESKNKKKICERKRNLEYYFYLFVFFKYLKKIK